jgi:NAD(P)H-dependent FMN reductase
MGNLKKAEMQKLVVISSSIRDGRKSHRVALYVLDFIRQNKLADAEILDLREYSFPLFHERLKYQESPLPEVIEFAEKVRSADGVIIVTPEYNGGYPASLKNVIDLLTDDWNLKPVAFVPVSEGAFGGSQVVTSLQFTMWKIGAITVPGPLRIPDVIKSFDDSGTPSDKPAMDKRTASLISKLLWFIESKKSMQD